MSVYERKGGIRLEKERCLVFTTTQVQENLPIVSRSVSLNEGVERFPIHPLELCLNVYHVDFAAGDHHSNERVVIRP